MKLSLLMAFIFTVITTHLAFGAATVFLQDGTKEVGDFVWVEDNAIYMNRSSDTYMFGAEEVKMEETLKYNRIGKYAEKISPSSGVLQKKLSRQEVKAANKRSKIKPTQKDAYIAATFIFAQRQFMEGFQGWCKEQHPESADKINNAIEEWDKRNATLIKKAQLVIKSILSREERESLMRDMEAENKVLSEKASAGPEQSRIRWCNEVPDKILSMHMDPKAHNPGMVQALMAYKVQENLD